MKKTLIAMGVLGAFSAMAFAASNVTLYGIIDEGVLVGKAKHGDTTAELKSGFVQGSRWGLKGVEDLGNGYNVGFILEQGFNVDTGNAADSSKAFNREAILSVNGGFGSVAFGRTGALGFAQSRAILTGWVFGTSWGLSSWTSAIGAPGLRMDNVLSYATPVFSGFSVHAMYSNGIADDTNKWSQNQHYYGIGVKYQANAIKSSLIFEAFDNKGTEKAAATAGSLFNQSQWAVVEGYDPANLTDAQKAEYKAWAKTEVGEGTAAAKRRYVVNYGLEYNFGSWTPMFAYQWNNQDEARKTHMFGLSAAVQVGGGKALLGARYLFGKDESITKGDDKVRAWNIGAGYDYPLSKRTALRAYAGYADGAKAWANTSDVAYNGYQVYAGIRHSF